MNELESMAVGLCRRWSLPANDFPSIDEVEATERVRMPEASLKDLIERTAFAMAQQDVRYYLNGLLFDLREAGLLCVATDGHRLSLCESPLEHSFVVAS